MFTSQKWQITTDFQVTKDCVMIYKGTESDVESYSAFFDNQKLRQTELNSVLKKKGVTDVYVCGLAADVCVGKLHWKIWSALYIDCL